MIRDLRLAARLLLQSKGWTAVVLLSVALGIGVNATLFSAINALLIKTLSVRQPEELVRLRWFGENPIVRSSSGYGYSGQTPAGQAIRSTFSFPAFERLRAGNKTLEDLSACAPGYGVNMVVRGRAEIASSFLASGNYFEVLGVPALIGRTITSEDDRPGAAPVAMISHRYWDRRFGRDPGVVGLDMTVNQTSVTIVGVTPPDYAGIQSLNASARDIHLPLHLDSQINRNTRLSRPTTWWLQIVGRLKPRVSLEQVRGNLEGVFQGAIQEGWEEYLAGLSEEEKERALKKRPVAAPSLDIASASRGVYDANPGSVLSISILGVVVVLVLLVVCANVANLQLSKMGARSRELMIRLSLGATRGRLIRQMLTESMLLSLIGGGLALLVTYWSRRLLPFGSPPPMDWQVFLFAACLSVLVGLAFGIMPALRGSRVDLADSLKDGGRSLSRSRSILGKFLLVGQVAVSVVLLIGAGLFLRTLHNLRHAEVGFETGDLLLVTVTPSLNQYEPARSRLLLDQLQEAFLAIPGVESVSLSGTALLSGNYLVYTIHVKERGDDDLEAHVLTVSPEFFETAEIPILLGRGFTRRDDETSPRVALINATAARQFFPGGSPLGRRFGFSPKKPEEVEVVGVVGDAKYSNLREAPPPTIYRSHLQVGLPGDAVFHLKAAVKPESLVSGVREAVRQVDPNLPLGQISTQIETLEKLLSEERTFALAYSLFGLLTLVLACIGLFGLMSYHVVQRTHEMGIRLALGAQRREVVGMVLRESLWLVTIGVAIGLAGALAAGRLVAGLLYDLAPTDPLTWTLVAVLMFVVAGIAGYLPARRASRVDPLIALRVQR